jgi:hypothetical protein
MDSFKEMAEEKMREAVTSQIQGEIDADEVELRAREQEYSALQSTDTRAEKRQKWMQSISGQAPAAFGAGAMDPTALGARTDGLGAAAGRPLRGLMGQQAQEEPRLGLGGMRAPMTSAKPLMGQTAAPPMRNVRQPLAQPGLPQPVRTVRQPIAAPGLVPQEEQATEEVAEEETLVGEETSDLSSSAPLDSETLEAQVIDEPELVETEIQASEEEPEDLTETVQETMLETETEDLDLEMEELASEAVLEEMDAEPSESEPATMARPTALLKPIRGVLKPLDEEEEVRTATLTPVGHMLVPAKERGSPPPATTGRPTTATLRPVRGKLTPVSKPAAKVLKPQNEDDEDE